MILYKYMTLKTARKILSGSSIQFSSADTFNDPFETFAGSHPAEEESVWGDTFRRMGVDGYRIICLTRDPLSPLMWAHYAESHRGVVLGIDCKIAGFLDKEKCVLPAQYGSVIYTRTKPNFEYERSSDKANFQNSKIEYDSNFLDVLQRNFLYKSSEWYYEEEVRVVKSVKSFPGMEINDENGALPNSRILLALPKNAIVDIYLGQRACDPYDEMHEFFLLSSNNLPNARLHYVSCDKSSWGLLSHELTPNWGKSLDDYFGNYP